MGWHLILSPALIVPSPVIITPFPVNALSPNKLAANVPNNSKRIPPFFLHFQMFH